MACIGCNNANLNANAQLSEFVARVSAMAYSRGITLTVNTVSDKEPDVLQRIKLGAMGAKGTGEVRADLVEVVKLALQVVAADLAFDDKTGIVRIIANNPAAFTKEQPKQKAEKSEPVTPPENGASV